MTHMKTYLWKEWAQNRSLAFSVLGVVLGILAVSLLVDAVDACEGMLLVGAPIVAVILGVYAMGRETGEIEAFWRSRPLPVLPWVLSKYVMGLLILGGLCAVIMIAQVFLVYAAELPERKLDVLKVLAVVYSFFVLAIYTAAFVLGAWIRGTIHALILSVGAVALIILVPLIVPWLNPWSLVFMIRPGDAPGFGRFYLGMAAFCGGMLWLCHALVTRRIQITQ